jgi:hypothetical protein
MANSFSSCFGHTSQRARNRPTVPPSAFGRRRAFTRLTPLARYGPVCREVLGPRRCRRRPTCYLDAPTGSPERRMTRRRRPPPLRGPPAKRRRRGSRSPRHARPERTSHRARSSRISQCSSAFLPTRRATSVADLSRVLMPCGACASSAAATTAAREQAPEQKGRPRSYTGELLAMRISQWEQRISSPPRRS